MLAHICETRIVDRKSFRREILEAWGYFCCYCGREANTLDHLVPKALGGGNNRGNLAACCTRCNLSKGSKSLEGWYRSQPFFNEDSLTRLSNWTVKGVVKY